MAALQLLVAGDTAIGHPAVDGRDDLDVARPVLRNQRPLDPRVVRVGHADEPAAVERRLPAAEITETNVADDSRVPDVEFVAVTEQIDIGEPDRVPALDAQLEDQPVRHVNKILVEHGHAAQDRRLAVVTAVYVGAGIMHAVGVFPLRRAARAQVAVARRGQRFAKPLRLRLKAVIGEQETVHGPSSSPRHTAALTPGIAPDLPIPCARCGEHDLHPMPAGQQAGCRASSPALPPSARVEGHPRRRCTQSPRPHRRAMRNNPQRPKSTGAAAVHGAGAACPFDPPARLTEPGSYQGTGNRLRHPQTEVIMIVKPGNRTLAVTDRCR